MKRIVSRDWLLIPVWFVASLWLLPPSLSAQNPPDANELLAQTDLAQTFDTSQGLATMTISDQLGKRVTEFKLWSRGRDDTFIEFTSAAEKGQKILKNAKELYLFFPDAEEITRLQGAALRQSMAGSDISYEDMTGNRNRRLNYNAQLTGEGQVDDRAAWILKLTAKSRNIAYAQEEIAVDKSNNLPIRVKYFDLSGKQLKEISFSRVQIINGRPISTRLLVKDSLKQNTSTQLDLHDLVINQPIPANTFSLDNLKW